MVRMGEEGNAQVFWWGNLKERDHSEDLSVVGRLILKCILKGTGCCGLDLSGSGYGQMECCQPSEAQCLLYLPPCLTLKIVYYAHTVHLCVLYGISEQEAT